MITISEHDLPITVAYKLINAKREISESESLARLLNRATGGDGTMDAFNDDELLEIAEHLMCYVKHADGDINENKNS